MSLCRWCGKGRGHDEDCPNKDENYTADMGR